MSCKVCKYYGNQLSSLIDISLSGIDKCFVSDRGQEVKDPKYHVCGKFVLGNQVAIVKLFADLENLSTRIDEAEIKKDELRAEIKKLKGKIKEMKQEVKCQTSR